MVVVRSFEYHEDIVADRIVVVCGVPTDLSTGDDGAAPGRDARPSALECWPEAVM